VKGAYTGAFRSVSSMLGALLLLVLAACGTSGVARSLPVNDDDPASVIAHAVASLDKNGPYRDPSTAEAEQARAAARLILDAPSDNAGLDRAFGGLGFTAKHGTDPATGRPYAMFTMPTDAEPAWGTVLIDRSAPVRVVLEVPHPAADLHTEVIGTALYRLRPGSVLLVAGAHRDAAGGKGDVAHNDRSMFHLLATEFAGRGIPQIQLHGFADRNLPEREAVVSTGSGPTSALAEGVAAAFSRAGLNTCRAWAQPCGGRGGPRHEPGGAAAAAGAAFLHVELGYAVRSVPARRDLVAKAMVEALG
jgi:hypothetical protein